MSGKSDETRRAGCSFEAVGIPGAPASGEGEAVVGDDGLTAAGIAVEWLDVETLVDAERVLTLGLWPEGTLRLSMMGRRHETFVAEARRARERARVAGLLAHGIAAPERFEGGLHLPGPVRDAQLLVWPTHVTVVPDGEDPFQVPFGAVTAIRFEPEAWRVVVETRDGTFAFGHLARKTDALARALAKARDAQGARLSAVAGSSLFADGRGVRRRDLRDFDRLVESWTAPDRAEGAAALLSRARPADEARIGLVELLDPDEAGLDAKVPLPENLAAFLLVPAGGRVVLELLSGPSAATYVFEGEADAIGRDLQALHFRRRALALSEKEAAGAAGRPYRLAFRRLAPLSRLRAATRGRLVHGEGWADALARALPAAG